MSFGTSENHNGECSTVDSEKALLPGKVASSFSLGKSSFSTGFIPSSFTCSTEVDPQHSSSTKEDSSLAIFEGKPGCGTQPSILTVSSELHSGSERVEEAKGSSSSLPSGNADRVTVSSIPFPYPPQRSEKPLFYPPHRPSFQRTPVTPYPPLVASSTLSSSSTASLRSSLITPSAAESSAMFRPTSTFPIADHAVMSTSPVVEMHSIKTGSSDRFPFASTSLDDSNKTKGGPSALWTTTDTSMSVHTPQGGPRESSRDFISDSSVREEVGFDRAREAILDEDRRRYARGQRSSEMHGFVRAHHRQLQKNISEPIFKSEKEAPERSLSTGCPTKDVEDERVEKKQKKEDHTSHRFLDSTGEEKGSALPHHSLDTHGTVLSGSPEWHSPNREGVGSPWMAVVPSSHSSTTAEKPVASIKTFPPSYFLLPPHSFPERHVSHAVEEPPSASMRRTMTASVGPSMCKDEEMEEKVETKEASSLPSTAPHKSALLVSFSSAAASVTGTRGALQTPPFENEEERLRGVQRQWRYLSIIENGGREPMLPTMKASAELVFSSGEKLKISRPPPLSSLLPSSSSSPSSSSTFSSSSVDPSFTRTSTVHSRGAPRGEEREAVVVKLAEEEEDTDDDDDDDDDDDERRRRRKDSTRRSSRPSSRCSVVHDDPHEEEDRRGSSRERQGKQKKCTPKRCKDGGLTLSTPRGKKKGRGNPLHSLSKADANDTFPPHVSPPSFSHRKFYTSIGLSAPLLHRRRKSLVGSIAHRSRPSYDASSSVEGTSLSSALSPFHHGHCKRGGAPTRESSNTVTVEETDRPRRDGSSPFAFFSAVPLPSSPLSPARAPQKSVSSFSGARRRSDIPLRFHNLGRKRSSTPQKYSKKIGCETISSPKLSYSTSTSSFSRKHRHPFSQKMSWMAASGWHRKRKERMKEENEKKAGGAEEERFSPRYVTSKSLSPHFCCCSNDGASFLNTRSPNVIMAPQDFSFSIYRSSPRKGFDAIRNGDVRSHSHVDPQQSLGRREIHFEMVDDADVSSTSDDATVNSNTDDALGRSKRGSLEYVLNNTQKYAREEEEGIGSACCPTVVVEKMTRITPYSPSAASTDRS